MTVMLVTIIWDPYVQNESFRYYPCPIINLLIWLSNWNIEDSCSRFQIRKRIFYSPCKLLGAICQISLVAPYLKLEMMRHWTWVVLWFETNFRPRYIRTIYRHYIDEMSMAHFQVNAQESNQEWNLEWW